LHYRLYTLDPSTVRTLMGSDLQADTDDQAIGLGHEAHADGQPFEIWAGQRLVLRTLAPPPSDESTPQPA
jgi:hypothetical protein